MYYTIDVVNSYSTHRLSKEGVFENIENRNSLELLPEDMIFETYISAKLFKSNIGEFVTVDGKKIKCNPTFYTLGDVTVEVKAHRTSSPKQAYFTKEQLEKLLLSGNDNYHNTLVVDLDGYVHLLSNDQKENAMFAVTYETFCAGNGYVGVKWNQNELNDLYESLLQGWAAHLLTSETQFVDYNDGTSAKQAIDEILSALERFK